jgi:glucose-1-phosphate adenylyltransferase
MRDVLAMVLAGGRVAELSVLTHSRPKSAVPFGGQYLVIDFVMSNLTHSGVRKVGILSQYRPSALIEHIGSGEPWGFWARDRFVKMLPPYQGSKRWDWYRGTADAIWQNVGVIESSGCEHVLVLSGDHVYQMDYRPLYDEHIERGADLTAVFLRIPGLRGQRSPFGVAELDETGRVTTYEEKPAAARGEYASLTIYLFRRDALLRHLHENARSGRTLQLYDEVLPAMVAEGRTHAHRFDGYWAYGRTVDAYYRANMDVLPEGAGPEGEASDARPPLPLDDWQVLTNEETLGLGTAPPAAFGPESVVRGSRVSPGAVVHGRVWNSVIAPNVFVAPGAEVRDSVLLAGCVVAEGARVTRTIADAGARIGEEARVGGAGDAVPNVQRHDTLTCGVTLLGERVVVPPRCVIGRNCIVGNGAAAPAGSGAAGLSAGQELADGTALDA